MKTPTDDAIVFRIVLVMIVTLVSIYLTHI